MSFPETVRDKKERSAVTIYGRTEANNAYRVVFHQDGKRTMKSFRAYGKAKTFARQIVELIAKGKNVRKLAESEMKDAVEALERLAEFSRKTGNRISLSGAIREFCDAGELLNRFNQDTGRNESLTVATGKYVEAAGRLNGKSLPEVIDVYSNTLAGLRPIKIADAVEKFVVARADRKKSIKPLRRIHKFADAFRNLEVASLSRDQIQLFLRSKAMKEFSAKTKNHYRSEIKSFLRWSKRNKYLSENLLTDLLECDSLRPEEVPQGEIKIISPEEFARLLFCADEPIRGIIALKGLAGLRTEEVLKMDWQHVFGRDGHIEVPSTIAKLRMRRVIEISPALKAWLEPYRNQEGKIWKQSVPWFHKLFAKLHRKAGVLQVKNALRHSFCSYCFAKFGEQKATAWAGHSAQMLHETYKALTSESESETWFSIYPSDRPENVVSMKQEAR